ncbi:hypothetical protein NUW54_g10108 [Trametes sanguinea]|uniref:Uncharacterized protein n=1 Tax=Trametes sanguinea TaxID=158606 RepID=A0ACC1P1F9_9APHY|nr:hypothetical protein NUW54_g10108 [Trametes sanguinea]
MPPCGDSSGRELAYKSCTRQPQALSQLDIRHRVAARSSAPPKEIRRCRKLELAHECLQSPSNRHVVEGQRPHPYPRLVPTPDDRTPEPISFSRDVANDGMSRWVKLVGAG